MILVTYLNSTSYHRHTGILVFSLRIMLVAVYHSPALQNMVIRMPQNKDKTSTLYLARLECDVTQLLKDSRGVLAMPKFCLWASTVDTLTDCLSCPFGYELASTFGVNSR